MSHQTYFSPLVTCNSPPLKNRQTQKLKNRLKVGLHSLGYVTGSREEAVEDYYPGYAEMFNKVGKERGWPPVNRVRFDAQTGPSGAIVIGNSEEVAEKILRHSEVLGGISRFTFQMDNTGLSHEQLLSSIDLIGNRIVPLLGQERGGKRSETDTRIMQGA